MNKDAALTLPGLKSGQKARSGGRTMLEIGLVLVGALGVLLLLGWVGLQLKPAPFPPPTLAAGAGETMALPGGLPAPVERFYRTLYGDRIPVITSAVISGRAEVRPVGPLSIPARFRFIHDAGQGYRHYIEAGLFGLPLLQVNERYLDGHALGETPFGIDEGDKVDAAANLGMWAEMLWMPAVFLTDPRVRWEPLDEQTAHLVVPFEDTTDHFIVRFNPQTGLIDWFESMRYHNQASAEKVLWLNRALEWGKVDGQLMNTVGAAIWMDDGKPWAVFHVEDVRLNVDVAETLRAKGP